MGWEISGLLATKPGGLEQGEKENEMETQTSGIIKGTVNRHTGGKQRAAAQCLSAMISPDAGFPSVCCEYHWLIK